MSLSLPERQGTNCLKDGKLEQTGSDKQFDTRVFSRQEQELHTQCQRPNTFHYHREHQKPATLDTRRLDSKRQTADTNQVLNCAQNEDLGDLVIVGIISPRQNIFHIYLLAFRIKCTDPQQTSWQHHLIVVHV